MKQESIRAALIDGTIHVIATEGLDKATTKRIGTRTGLNEAYIYRCFKGKEDMYVQTFQQLDYEFLSEVMKRVKVMEMEQFSMKQRCRMFFDPMWRFILGDKEKAICYIQYFHSHYFVRYSLQGRRERFAPLINHCTPAFKPDVDVWLMLNHVLDILFASANRVYTGELADNERTANYVFDLIYSGVEPHLAWTE